MKIVTATGGLAQTNCYLIADEATGKAVLFDAPDHTVGPVLEEAKKQKWEIVGLWLTHGHFDHIADHAEVTRALPLAQVLVHALDEPKLRTPMLLFPLPFTIPPRGADARVEDGQTLALGSLKVQVIHTPGHAPGHVMYHFPEQKVLVGGDLIIMGGVGRFDLPDSDFSAVQASVRRVMRLPLDTLLLPGHGSPGPLSDELSGNPFVRDAVEAGGGE